MSYYCRPVFVDGEDVPRCSDHGEPMLRDRQAGGHRVCVVKKRARNARYRAAGKGRAADAHHTGTEKRRAVRVQAEARRRARKNGGAFDDWTREQVFALTDGLCAFCRAKPATEIEHVVAFKNGGSSTWGHVVGACGDCNRSKNSDPTWIDRNHPEFWDWWAATFVLPYEDDEPVPDRNLRNVTATAEQKVEIDRLVESGVDPDDAAAIVLSRVREREW